MNSKQRSSSKIVKERAAALPPSSRPSHHPDKVRAKNGGYNEVRQKIDDRVSTQPPENLIRKCVKDNGTGTGSNELVKYMHNLPAYLLHSETGENLQEKALSFGVLNWGRLEKWKHKQTRIPEKGTSTASCSRTDKSIKIGKKSSTSSVGDERHGPQCALLSSNSDHHKASETALQKLENSETQIKTTSGSTDGQKVTSRASKSFGKIPSDVSSEKGRKKDLDKRITSHPGNLALKCHGDDENMRSTEAMLEFNHKKKDRCRKFISHKELPSYKVESNSVSLSSKDVANDYNGGTKKRVDKKKQQEFDIDLNHGERPREHKNIVVLIPKESPQTSSPKVLPFPQLRTSFYETLTEPRSVYSDEFHPQKVPSGHYSEFPQSCPFHSELEAYASSVMMPPSLVTARDMDFSSVVSQSSSCSNEDSSLLSEVSCQEREMLDVKLAQQCLVGNPKELMDQETAKLAARKVRSTSPTRRFSFSFGRIGRSFSFKEGSSSSLSRFNSTYHTVNSGPLTSDSSAFLDNSKNAKKSCPSRTRGSPLRRLLNPLWKHRAASALQLEEPAQIVREDKNSLSSMTISVNESLQTEKNEGTTTMRALLQHTVKNGLPLFKFVQKNESNILAATLKDEKDDSRCNFTFYLVNEMKRRNSGWIGQGSKEKNCGYAYNVVGQMEVLSHFTELDGQNSKGNCMLKEYVLIGVDIPQGAQELPQSMLSRELAAAVIKFPCENSSCDEGHNEKPIKDKRHRCLEEDKCLCSSAEHEGCISTTIIIPGGVHGLPSKGEPSSLTYRWKSGGLCDCGGWDIGCKLHILSNHDQHRDTATSIKHFPVTERFELYLQGGVRVDSKESIFSLALLKDGIFSVEFKSSISLLQAFFICVVVISSNQKPPKLLKTTSTSEQSLHEDYEIQGKVSPRFVPNPPHSPFGRI